MSVTKLFTASPYEYQLKQNRFKATQTAKKMQVSFKNPIQ